MKSLSLALVTLAVCVSSATASGGTLVSCLNAKGLAIGWYTLNASGNGYGKPTTLPANFKFGKDGNQEYMVVKGKLPLIAPEPNTGKPVLYVFYYSSASKPQGNDGPNQVNLGHFSVVWQHEPQRVLNIVLRCVKLYT
ncbi:MAG TPA: hypothetical protein VHM72_08850 [Solirubrobacteraceae bacterium]|nr:hypothetical protein [Solirubrobacteraceae bacterium]